MKCVEFGNILSVQSGLIVHGCNAQGVMGGGVALAIKTKYPAAYEAYANYCRQRKQSGLPLLGTIIPQRVGNNSLFTGPELWILNAITQENFGREPCKRYVSYQALASCFKEVVKIANETGLDVHYPLIGAGLGGGDWAVISDIIDSAFEGSNIKRTLWLLE